MMYMSVQEKKGLVVLAMELGGPVAGVDGLVYDA
jgi:hypothetical protein